MGAEAKRQEMLEAQKAQKADALDKKKSVAGGPISDARKELSKTKEQLEEEKKIALSIRIKPLELEALDSDELKAKANEIHNIIIQLETDKYDYEQRRLTQELDLKELKERQKAQLRQKAMKKGLDPEALTGKYPPMIRMYSKYERRTDTRTYEDRKKLYEGGWEVIRAESLDAIWKEKFEEWSKRPSKKLPKWFGERPGKKAGDAPTPEGEEDGGEEAAAEEDSRRKRRRRRSTMRRSKPASLNLRSAETFLVSKLVLPSPPPARRVHPRRPTVHFHLWRISCCNKYDFYSWYGSNDSDGTINSKEHYFCYNTNVKLCNA